MLNFTDHPGHEPVSKWSLNQLSLDELYKKEEQVILKFSPWSFDIILSQEPWKEDH